MVVLEPMQDLLSLGNGARMNIPGNPAGNWGWRMSEDQLNDSLRERLKYLHEHY